MGELKIRKIGNSLGAIFPKDWELKEGDILTYEKKGNGYLLDTTETAREHDRQLIEESFAEYEAAKMVSEDQLKERFGKYGWGSEMADFTIGYTQQFYQSLAELVSWWEEELLFTEVEISRFVTLIYESLQKVRHFPQMYPEVSEVYGFTQPTHRIVIGKALALFYRVDEARQVIVVGRIFQTKQLKLQF